MEKTLFRPVARVQQLFGRGLPGLGGRVVALAAGGAGQELRAEGQCWGHCTRDKVVCR